MTGTSVSQTANERVVVLNENEKINLNTYQQIYNEITGKSEEMSKWYNTLYQIEFADILVLHQRIQQHLSQYSINGSNCHIRVYYEDEINDTFSSFDKFQLQHSHSSSAVERVLLRYNFLIIHPETQRSQNYKMEISLGSRITIVKSFLKEHAWYDGEYIPFFLSRHSGVEIEYVDYNVGKTLLATIDDWYKTLHVAKQSKVLQYLQKNSRYLPAVSRNILVATTLTSILIYAPDFFSVNHTMEGLGLFLLLSLTSLYFLAQIGDFIGKLARKAVNTYCTLSFVKLNKADEHLITDTKKQNSNTFLKLSIQLVVNIGISVISSIIAYYLMN